MTFHFMTGLWLEDMGLEITEVDLITEQGRVSGNDAAQTVHKD
jgi:hypothetical protein